MDFHQKQESFLTFLEKMKNKKKNKADNQKQNFTFKTFKNIFQKDFQESLQENIDQVQNTEFFINKSKLEQLNDSEVLKENSHQTSRMSFAENQSFHAMSNIFQSNTHSSSLKDLQNSDDFFLNYDFEEFYQASDPASKAQQTEQLTEILLEYFQSVKLLDQKKTSLELQKERHSKSTRKSSYEELQKLEEESNKLTLKQNQLENKFQEVINKLILNKFKVKGILLEVDKKIGALSSPPQPNLIFMDT